jgi:GxxExxY protein
MESTILNSIKEVSDTLGSTYKENIYQNALYSELNTRGLLCQTEVIVPVLFKGITVGYERADIVVYENEKISYILELKSQTASIGLKEIQQLRKYLINLKCDYGILINFNNLEVIKVTKELSQKISYG